MSFDLQDWDVCDDHERTFLIGSKCPECVARELEFERNHWRRRATRAEVPLALVNLAALRDDLFAFIAAELAEDDHCKPYEGDLSIEIPGFFGRPEFRVKLSCYLIGPQRHYEWTGDSAAEVVDACCRDVRRWIAEAESERKGRF